MHHENFLNDFSPNAASPHDVSDNAFQITSFIINKCCPFFRTCHSAGACAPPQCHNNGWPARAVVDSRLYYTSTFPCTLSLVYNFNYTPR